MVNVAYQTLIAQQEPNLANLVGCVFYMTVLFFALLLRQPVF